MIIYVIPIFIILPLILMAVMIFLPTFIGKRIPPSFSKEKTQILNMQRNELYNLIINYENYPAWLKYISTVHTEKISGNKLKIMQTYSNRRTYQELIEVRRIENSEISIVKTENEFTALWTYIFEDAENGKTKMTIKETMYVYHPYLRFMLKYILTDENCKSDFFRRVKIFINKNSQ
ncbi:SRPBCC family protein [uncultured Brachyspira sp.]|uniref:SRPBCC family protein n=1 Tax=uncultured Brachyspira sp. TaxID=221953 RepID=UPI0025EAA567|nr:SRPBCC family protein [uncultured Brachyspira sp.]